MDKPISLQSALAQENPLQIVGTINAYAALLAQRAGFNAIYLSGGAVSACNGLPDLGLIDLHDVLNEVSRITYISDLPLLVDIDTGWGSAFNIARAIKSLINAQAAGVHIEDQVQAKRCGHRPRKELANKDEMCDRIKAAVDAKTEHNFTIMARTDALANEGLEQTLERLQAYLEVGADMIFLEGATTLKQYQTVSKAFSVPVLANMTEFGVTPLFTKSQLQEVGVQLILYPVTAFRAMSKAAQEVYQTIRHAESQASLLTAMQTRNELYDVLHYHDYEEKLNELFAKGKLS